MQKNYKHILSTECQAIKIFLDLGFSHNKISKELKRSQSTITRYINRNSVNGVFRVNLAQELIKSRRKSANMNQIKIVAGSRLERYIIDKITNEELSPEQIAGRIKLDWEKLDLEQKVTHETIYNWIYNLKDIELKIKLTSKFRSTKGKYRRRHGTSQRRKENEELKKKRIDKRPKEVETRSRLGDWEGDTIVGGEKTVHILTHVDRRSGYLIADKLEQATAKETQTKTINRFQKLPNNKRYTITYDNGVQFALHEDTEAKLNTAIYFANPYHSWERGTNENTNGLLRQYFPKGSSFKNITQKELDQVVKKLNNRPRKRLNYRTPHEIFILGMNF